MPFDALKGKAGLAWVTGAGGFLGGALVSALAADGWRVVATGRQERPEGLPTAVDWVPADLIEASPWAAMSERAGPPDRVFHCAGPGTVSAAAKDPLDGLAVTVQATAALCEWLLRHAPGARLVAASSAAVYGIQPTPWREEGDSAPISIYGWHKHMMECVIESARQRGLSATAIRFFSLYGPGLRKQVLWETRARARHGGPVLELAGTGQERRDFLHVDDAVALMRHLAVVNRLYLPPSVNGGSGRSISVADLMALWLPLVAPGVSAHFSGAPRPGDPPATEADTTLMTRVGFTPRWTLAEGLRDCARDLL